VPTANLSFDPRVLLPAHGVYVIEVEVGPQARGGVMNVGRRPTLTPGDETHVEVHLFDWGEDLLGRTLQVYPLRRLRPERRFPSAEALRSAIERDIADGRECLERLGRGDRRADLNPGKPYASVGILRHEADGPAI
jgi:riboflavin kinase/FMN adenylyltransferase